MSWLDADDDDEEDDDDYQFLEEVSENWRRGTTIPPRSVFKIDGLVPALSPLQLGLGSELSPKAGLQSPTRYKAKPLRDNDKSTQEREDMYEVEQLREATDEENEVSKLFVFCDEGCEDNLLHDAREKMSHQDSRSFATIHTCSKEKQECTRRSLKHKSIHTKLFEKLSKGQFPFDWSKKNGGAHGGNKVPSSELKRNDKNVRIPTVAQANGIQGCKTKNVHQLHKELTDAAPETHTFSSKTHNGLCSSLSIPSNQKIHSYHNPLQGASASFIHRLTEIASLECDTIRQEKIRKLKKRSDC